MITNIQFRWLCFNDVEFDIKTEEHHPLFFWKKMTRIVKGKRWSPKVLQSRIWSETLKEWSGWVDVPHVNEDDANK